MERVPIPVAIALLLNRGRVFMLQRPADKPLAGQWEFPGGKVEVGEPPVDALRRELREELRLAVRHIALFGVYSHVYDLPEGPVHYVLIAYRASVRPGPWAAKGAWIDAEIAGRIEVVPGSRPVLFDLLAAKRLHPGSRRTSAAVSDEGHAPRKAINTNER